MLAFLFIFEIILLIFFLKSFPRQHLRSQGHDMTDDDDDNTDENFNDEANYMEEHYHNYMVARERLQEFSGRVPQQRKKKATDSENNPQQQHREARNDEEDKVKNKPKVRSKKIVCNTFYFFYSK